MKKRIITILLMGLIALSSTVPSFAAETADTLSLKPATYDEAVPVHEPTTEPTINTEPTQHAEQYVEPTENKAEQKKAMEPTEATEPTEAVEDTLVEHYDATPYIKQGDANGDGEIDKKDVTAILRYISGKESDSDKDILLYGDVNGNKEIDIHDATMLQRYLSGAISYYDLIYRQEQMPLYLQYKEPWGNYPFGDGTIANCGCGPTSIAMVASYLSGSEIKPDNVAQFISNKENGGKYGHYVPGAGMTHDVWELCAKHYDFIFVGKANDIDEAYEALQNGQVVISSQGRGLFTSGGHFIVLSGLWSDGKIRVNDPNDNTLQKNFMSRHFTKEAIAENGYCYYVFDSYDSKKAPESEEEFVHAFNTYFKKRGYSKAAICGMLGNIYAECGMQPYWYFAENVPDADGAPGNSGGICMWYGGNCQRFKRDCPDWNDTVIAQFKYLAETLENNGKGTIGTKYIYGCTGCKDTLMGKKTAENRGWIEQYGKVTNTKEGAKVAARAFMNFYERPNETFEKSIRGTKAAEYWDMLD